MVAIMHDRAMDAIDRLARQGRASDFPEEAQQMREVVGLGIPHRQVAAGPAARRPRVRHQRRHAPDIVGMHLIVLRAQCQGGHRDFVQAVPALPILEGCR